MYYFTKRFFLRNKKSYTAKSFAYKVDQINFVDIDSKFDLEIAKCLKKIKIRN
jgi:CMP-N-acetylneuraminic acid synthetase